MYEFESSKSVSMYGGKHGYGFRVTDIDKALDKLDFKDLQLNEYEIENFSYGCHFQHLREGVLAYVQKGRNTKMKNPFIVTDVEYNPNKNTDHSINITFEPTIERSYEVELYAQLPTDPTSNDQLLNFRKHADYIGATDRSHNRLADNGCFWVVPDMDIVKTFDDLHISEGLQLVI